GEQNVQQSFDLTYDDQFQYFESIQDDLRLIQTSESSYYWMTEGEILDLIRNKTKFMDITDYRELGTIYKTKKKQEFPAGPAFYDEVTPFIGNLTTEYMQKNLEKFTSFRNRYFRSKFGAQSSNWLFEQVSNIVKGAKLDASISVSQFEHKWPQKSIIARFEGSDPEKDNEVVIVGAHQDSVNMWMPYFGRAPGADDDGSGTVTILEAFRVLVEGNFRPKRTVEFHWYSAEEGGLLGSQDIALKYEKEGIDVVGMLQNDMTGYVGKEGTESLAIITDYVDTGLTEFLKSLVNTYASIPSIESKCGYACSDHASWTKAGYPSAFVIEDSMEDTNPYIHSSDDLIKHLSFEHMLEFAKLSVSMAIELSYI
ncbi:291_t:CDS:2, partial [Acaulospora morrowiae]